MVEGLFWPPYIQVSAGLWVAGRASSAGGVIACTGRRTFTVAGAFGTGTLIRVPNHPNDTSYAVVATPRAQGSRLSVSYNPIFVGEAAIFFTDVNNNNHVATEFSFMIP